MTTTSTGLATMRCQELAAAPLAGLITLGDRGYAEALELLSQRC